MGGPQAEGLLRVHLFGQPHLEYRGEPLKFAASAKTLALLGYVLLHPGVPLDRDKIAFALWPDETESDARANLRRHLYGLLRALPPPQDDTPWILSDSKSVRWNPAARATIDVWEFERLARGGAHTDAVALYAGDLLERVEDEWLDEQRTLWRDRCADSLLALTAGSHDRASALAAITHARRLQTLDPWREDAIRELIRLRHATGDRAGALQEYREFAARLQAEFGVEPAPETTACYEAAVQGVLPQFDGTPAVRPAPRHNFPAQLSRFIGRESEAGEVGAAIAQHRLVTVTGPGGVGKSRLAQHVAETLLPEFTEGARLIELAALPSGTFVVEAVAAAAGLRESSGTQLRAKIIDHLRERSLLLIFDNCEHVAGACADLAAAILGGCPGVRILATSREPLNVGGEILKPLRSLASAESVALFTDRTNAVRPGFALSERNASTLFEICRRLDGIPLALELAAARAKVLSPEQILERLADRFALLTGGTRTALPHQQTLRSTIDWSYDLLAQPERALLARLAIFAGGMTLEAAEAVCADDAIAPSTVLDLLASLVDKSLVTMTESAESVRYTLLETIREYALVKLRAEAAEPALRERHLRFYAGFAERTKHGLAGAMQMRALDALDAETDNFRAALGRGLEHTPKLPEAFALAAALAPFWLSRSRFSEGRRWFEAALAAPESRTAPLLRARLLIGAGTLATAQDDYRVAEERYQEALPLCREGADGASEADALHGLATLEHNHGNFERAASLYRQAADNYQACGDLRGAAKAHLNLGLLAEIAGRYDEADDLLAAALHTTTAGGDAQLEGWILNALGSLAVIRENLAEAADYYTRALHMKRAAHDDLGISVALYNLGRVANRTNNLAGARAYLAESLRIANANGLRAMVANCLEGFAHFALLSGSGEDAARLAAAAENMRDRLGRAGFAPKEHDDIVAAIHAELGSERSAALWERGRAMDPEHAVHEALRL